MEISQANQSSGLEKAAGMQPQEQRADQQTANTEGTTTAPVDVVTISQEARNINNTRTTEQAPPANNTETTRERDVAQTVQRNQQEETATNNTPPERSDNINQVA